MNKTIDTYYGNIFADVPKSDFISQCLYEYGEWGLLECYFVSQLLPKGYIAVDIGAFIGTFSLGLSIFGASKIIVAEPNPLVLPSLKFNLDTNCNIPYHLIETAIGLQDGEQWTLAVDENNLGGTQLVKSSSETSSNITVSELKTIRSLYGEYDLLKIDAEGHENNIILSDKDYIAHKCQIVFFEENEDSEHEEIIEFLLNNQFNLYLCIFPVYNENNYNASKKRLFNIACEANILASRTPIAMNDELKKLGCDMIAFKSLEEFQIIRHHVPRWGETSWNNLSKTELKGLLSKTTIRIHSLMDKNK